MADSHYHHGDMDISQQKKTWVGFTKFIKWSTVAVAVMTIIAIIAIT